VRALMGYAFPGNIPRAAEHGRARRDRRNYERHRPELTTLYRLVQQNAATFFAQAEAAAGADLPQFVKAEPGHKQSGGLFVPGKEPGRWPGAACKAEFDAFLECGILARGFLRLRCGDCGHDKLVAFSCKRRGFCPSCGARRMAQTAAHLVDHVIPHVPVRQWVLSLPIPLRLLLAAQNLNIHLHCLVLDGVYRCGTEGTPQFVEGPAPTDEALQAVLHKIITRMMKLLTRRGVLVEEQGSTYMADNDGDADDARTLRPLQAAACTYRIAFGPRAGLQGADGAGRYAQVEGVQADAVRRHRRVQPARRRALRHRRAPGAGATVPLHHPPGPGQRTRANQRRRPGGAQAQDPLA
jgi:hypothetical protein